MAAMPEIAARAEALVEPSREAVAEAKPVSPPPVLPTWLRTQSINVNRHAAALRPFRREEFGAGAAAPSEGHIQAVNALMKLLRGGLLKMTKEVTDAAAAASQEPSTPRLQETVHRKERAHNWVQAVERIWDFYFE